jgi:hypothetical protein
MRRDEGSLESLFSLMLILILILIREKKDRREG